MDARCVVCLRSAGMELLDGCDPGSFLFDPAACGIGRYPPFDLLESGLYDSGDDLFSSLPVIARERIIELAPARMPALNKSTGRTESHKAYYASVPAADGSSMLIVHYTWFEAAPARFHLWLHTILEVAV